MPNEVLKYWIDLAKWFIVSVCLVIATMVIDAGFKDRAAGIVEINAYDKYVTNLIVLNKEVGPRRLLAQYFANVTASEKLRKGWADYFKKVDREYNLIAEHDSTLAREQRALATKTNPTRSDSMRGQEIKIQRLFNEQQLNATPRISSSTDARGTKSNKEAQLSVSILDGALDKTLVSIQAEDSIETSAHTFYKRGPITENLTDGETYWVKSKGKWYRFSITRTLQGNEFISWRLNVDPKY